MSSGLEELGIADDDDEIFVSASANGGTSEARAQGSSGTTLGGSATSASDVENSRYGKTAESNSGDIVDLLADVGLFAELDKVQLVRLAQLCSELRLSRGSYVFEFGDTGDGLYMIVHGAVRISRKIPGVGDEALAILRVGDYFGEMSLIDDEPRSADAICEERVHLLRLPKAALYELMWNEQTFGYELLWRLVRLLSKRLRETNNRLTMLTATSKF